MVQANCDSGSGSSLGARPRRGGPFDPLSVHAGDERLSEDPDSPSIRLLQQCIIVDLLRTKRTRKIRPLT